MYLCGSCFFLTACEAYNYYYNYMHPVFDLPKVISICACQPTMMKAITVEFLCNIVLLRCCAVSFTCYTSTQT